MKRVIIDTDPGIDDALALFLALKSPELRVEAITTVAGNAPVEDCTRNVFILLQLLEVESRPVVARGAACPLERELQTAVNVHGDDGLGGLSGYRNSDGLPRYPQPQQSLAPVEAADLILEIVYATAGGQPHHREAVLETRDQLERRRPYRAGRAEYAHAFSSLRRHGNGS